MTLNACAIIGGMDTPSSKRLDELAREAGFELTRPFTSLEAAERQSRFTPLCYFVFKYQPDLEPIANRIVDLRASRQSSIRYAPVVCFVAQPSRAEIIACIRAGIDDIVTLPVGAADLKRRMRAQTGRPVVYFETGDYFGPDRRRHLMGRTQPGGPERRKQSSAHKRFHFVRKEAAGIRVLNIETYDSNGVLETA